MTETREAPTPREPREVWPHRPDEHVPPMCEDCLIRDWPCPSQRYLDGIVAALAEAEADAPEEAAQYVPRGAFREGARWAIARWRRAVAS